MLSACRPVFKNVSMTETPAGVRVLRGAVRLSVIQSLWCTPSRGRCHHRTTSHQPRSPNCSWNYASEHNLLVNSHCRRRLPHPVPPLLPATHHHRYSRFGSRRFLPGRASMRPYQLADIPRPRLPLRNCYHKQWERCCTPHNSRSARIPRLLGISDTVILMTFTHKTVPTVLRSQHHSCERPPSQNCPFITSYPPSSWCNPDSSRVYRTSRVISPRTEGPHPAHRCRHQKTCRVHRVRKILRGH